MPTINTRDGAQIFYKDWGTGQPIVLSHGWPLNADAWDEQLHFLASHGYRAIAHDRRGHGRSSQTWTGNDMDTYADDLAALVESLRLAGLTTTHQQRFNDDLLQFVREPSLAGAARSR